MLTHKVSPSSRGEHSSQRSIHSEVHKPIQERSTLYVATSEGNNASGNDNYNNPIKQVSSTAKEWKASKSSPIAYPVACGLAAVSLGTLVCVCIKRSQTLRVHRVPILWGTQNTPIRPILWEVQLVTPGGGLIGPPLLWKNITVRLIGLIVFPHWVY